MTFIMILFCLTYLIFGKLGEMTDPSSSVGQGKVQKKDVGDTVTFQCNFTSDALAKYLWYKQTMGHMPKVISTFYSYDKNGTFYDEIKNNQRFTLDAGKGKNNLKISELLLSDSATYYCASSSSENLAFEEGITLIVKGSGSNVPVLVHQSTSEIIQPKGSMTLNCTFHTETCDGEHSVYWFSEESQPGLIYTHGGRNDQCERNNNRQTHTCVYNFMTKNWNISYHCAVALCGHILLRDGTKSEDDGDSYILVYVLSGALSFTTILTGLLAFLVHIIHKRNSCKDRESDVSFSAAPIMHQEDQTDEGDLQYAAIRINKDRRVRRQMNNTEDQCVYSTVKR